LTRTEMCYAISNKYEKYRLKFSRFAISNDGSYVKTKQCTVTKPNNMKDRRTATDFVNSNRDVVINSLYARGAFYYARDSGNFGRKSNGKVRFGSF